MYIKRQEYKEILKETNSFSKNVIRFSIMSIIIFTIGIFFIHWESCYIPDSLIHSFYAFFGAEMFAVADIRKQKTITPEVVGSRKREKRFSKTVVIVTMIFVWLFTIGVFFVQWYGRFIPDSLIYAAFSFCGTEMLILAGIEKKKISIPNFPYPVMPDINNDAYGETIENNIKE
jgi:hypothetical protein